MKGESKLQRIFTDELPDLLTRLDDGQTTELAFIGQIVGNLPKSPGDWPVELQGRVVIQPIGKRFGLLHELLQFDRLQGLTL